MSSAKFMSLTHEKYDFSSVCSAIRAWLFYSASESVVARLRKNLFTHLLNQVPPNEKTGTKS